VRQGHREEQRSRLEAALRDALVPRPALGDSAPKPPSGRALEDSLRKAARDLFEGFFGSTKRDSGRH